MISREENKMLQLAARGDRTSLEYLVNAYRDLAYTIAIKIVSNREDAEEVVQDAFLKAFASLEHFKKTAKFSTWLYRIVYNTAVTKRRSKKTAAIFPLNSVEDVQPIDIEFGEINLMGIKERKKFVNLALDKLDSDDQLILTLYYIAEKQISEICQIMDMKKSAIKMRLLRGRKQVESELTLLLGKEIKDLYEQ